MKQANNIKFRTQGKKITLTVKDKNNNSLVINTIVREQFTKVFGLRYILRCDIKEYLIELFKLGRVLTIDSLEIEGEKFNFHPIELYNGKDITLPIIEFIVNPDRGEKIEVYNVYIDKISYQATHKAFTPFYNLDIKIPD